MSAVNGIHEMKKEQSVSAVGKLSVATKLNDKKQFGSGNHPMNAHIFNQQNNGEESTATLSISAEGIEMLKKQEELEQKEYEEQAEEADEAGKQAAEMAKLMEVARRIANGDQVPATDEKKLMEFNAKLYQAAKAAAIVNANKKHKEYDTIFEEEEDTEQKEKLQELDETETTGETTESVETEEILTQ